MAGDHSEGNTKKYPTPFQQQALWWGLTALAITGITATALTGGWLVLRGISFLQPLIIPLVIAWVLTYLLEPVVDRLNKRGWSHFRAGLTVFIGFMLSLIILLAVMIVPLVGQIRNLVNNYEDITTQFEEFLQQSFSEEKVSQQLENIADWPFIGDILKRGGDNDASGETALPENGPATEGNEATPDNESSTSDEADDSPGENGNQDPDGDQSNYETVVEWTAAQVPAVVEQSGKFLRSSIGGFFGAFGLLISLLITPIYLFFFMTDGSLTRTQWKKLIPLPESSLRTEIISLFEEINNYLVAFYRGQILVSLIDGAITIFLLSILGVKYSLLIGVMVGILGVIPYLGVTISYIPALIISIVQAANGEWYLGPEAPVWVLPVLVTLVFVLVNNLDGVFIAPKIVGDAVSLHPFVVILSVFAWSIILGGLLGALIAVPLTATLKVLMRRYIWGAGKNDPDDENDHNSSAERITGSNSEASSA